MIPEGLCQCGCGQPTKRAKQSLTAKNYVKGQFMRYVAGHNYTMLTPKFIVDERSGCWVWQRSKVGQYGRLFDPVAKKNVMAHRWYYEQAKGAIPQDFQVDHLCKNPSCVNPDHLEAVTAAVNSRRSGTTKLKPEQVIEIRRRREEGEKITDIAMDFSITHPQVSHIALNKSWATLEI